MRAIGVLVALIVIGSPAPARADATDQKLADQKFIEGRDLLKAEKYDEACIKFHEAQKFDETAVVILLNLGLCYEKQKKLAQALKWYRKTQTASTEAKDKEAVKEYADAAVEATTKLAAQVSHVTLVISALPPDAVITIDNATVDKTQLTVEVDAGPRLIEANAPGKVSERKEIVVVDGTAEKPATYSHTFSALANADVGAGPPRTKRRLLGIAIAVGAIGIAAAATMPYSKKQADKFNSLEAGVGGPNGTGAPNAKRNMRIAGGIAVAVGAAGLAAGGYFFFTKPKESNQTAFTPVITPDQIGVAFGGGF